MPPKGYPPPGSGGRSLRWVTKLRIVKRNEVLEIETICQKFQLLIDSTIPFFQQKFRKSAHILEKPLDFLKNYSNISKFHFNSVFLSIQRNFRGMLLSTLSKASTKLA